MKVFQNFNLELYNSYKIKSSCKTAYFPQNEYDVIELFTKLDKYHLIGSGHNIILSKEYYDEPFIIFNGNFKLCKITNNIIEAESGISMLELSELAAEKSLSGLEIFYDIPSSLGGAVVMNAGASGEEIKDVLLKVRYYDLLDRQIKEIEKDSMSFQYRNSFFQINTDKIILKVWLELNNAPKNDILSKMKLIKDQRWAKQPREYPNAGSVFKRPPGFYVGAMMDDLKLKGYTVGGAKISEKHGGFIVNYNNAKGSDILTIIDDVKQKIKNKFGVDLEVEQRIL
jgi:UDP-N-acetylmuramate dehydrogenase